MKRFIQKVILLTAVLFFCLNTSVTIVCSSEVDGVTHLVLSTELTGVVGISMENYINKILEQGIEEKASLILFQLDTPGGLVTSMRGITNAILDSQIPIIVWVSPRGSRAASAGAFIVQAASIAAMAPGTNIGAAHPVQASGGDVPSEEMNKKITNDLAAQIRSLAQLHGRDSEKCSKMVTESISLTAEEALDARVIDIIESDLGSLLKRVEGRAILVAGEKRILSTAGYELKRVEMTPREKVLQFISSPTVAYLLLMVGIYAIIFEVLSPGGFVMGVAGAVMVLLGAYGLRMLPINGAGIILLLAGIAVMVLDLFVGGIGILSLFGMAALIVGSLIVFRAPGGELLNVSLNVIVGVVLAISIFFLMAITLILRTMRNKASSGREGLVGSFAEAIEDLEPEGMVRCHGEIWKARIKGDQNIKKGTVARVVKIEGLVLLVEPFERKDEKKEVHKNDGNPV